MKLVLVHTVGQGTYRARCLADTLRRGEAAMLYDEMRAGRGAWPDDNAINAWRDLADYVVFYTDGGWSESMVDVLINRAHRNLLFMLRALDGAITPAPPARLTKLERTIMRNSFDDGPPISEALP